jgi:hypothetical protein
MEAFKAPKRVKEVAEEQVVGRLSHGRQNAFQRFPLLFTLLAAFGVVATTDGFQRLMSKIPIMANNPYITLIIGLVALLITGTLYKKL